MKHVNNNGISIKEQGRHIQLLVPACRSVNQTDINYAWLHGYCLINCHINADIVVGGEVRIGDPHADNVELIGHLAASLDPTAVLAGNDLTNMLGRIGRLPIDAIDPAPALALLGKLQSMLDGQAPIDLAITPQSRNAVAAEASSKNFGRGEDRITYEVGQSPANTVDSGNPRLLAEWLADEASACLLALGRLTLTEAQMMRLDIAWEMWRQRLVPVLQAKEVQPI